MGAGTVFLHPSGSTPSAALNTDPSSATCSVYPPHGYKAGHGQLMSSVVEFLPGA